MLLNYKAIIFEFQLEVQHLYFRGVGSTNPTPNANK